MTKILFLCSKNKLRSPTAEAIFSGIEGWEVYSAGISNDAEVYVSLEDIEWADYIFVMEKVHKKKLSNKFGAALDQKKVISLGIPDDYEYMEEELISILNAKVPNLVRKNRS
ncbi:phosphotyrosine protein phosphatase [Pseudoalteromonas sp. YIC-656]|uniref:low molecular weight protein tyrosine phosphatase family protein n=1 Tax=Pseudoalteromonas pernae TaxID=3118054 RepID=UPI0032426621